MDNKSIVLNAMRSQGAADAAALAAKSVDGDADGTTLIAAEHQIPTWRQRDFTDVPIGTPYRYNGQVYKLWQAHDSTNQPDWNPDKAVSLWDICHTTDPKTAKEYVTSQGTRGMYQVDECCFFEGKTYRCTAANTVHSPKELPASWDEVTAEEMEVEHEKKLQRDCEEEHFYCPRCGDQRYLLKGRRGHWCRS